MCGAGCAVGVGVFWEGLRGEALLGGFWGRGKGASSSAMLGRELWGRWGEV